MASMNKFFLRYAFLCLCTLMLIACSVSYKFNGASIDYAVVKTIQIDVFPIRSTYVWTPMQSIFQNKLTDIFVQQRYCERRLLITGAIEDDRQCKVCEQQEP